MQTQNKWFTVSGTFHGSIIFAPSEGAARRTFHEYYNGESIINICLYIGGNPYLI